MASSSSSGLPNETNNDFGDDSIDGRVAADLDPKEITRLTAYGGRLVSFYDNKI